VLVLVDERAQEQTEDGFATRVRASAGALLEWIRNANHARLRRRHARRAKAKGAAQVIVEVARRPEDDHSAAVPFGFTPAPKSRAPSLAVMCHLFHADVAMELRRYLENIPQRFDLFLTTDTRGKHATLEEQFRDWPHGSVEVRLCENRGRDVAPKLVTLRDVYDRYDLVLHLHSKQSRHASVLAAWRGYLFETLLGSPAVVGSILETFAREPRMGIVAAQHFEPCRQWIHWGGNLDLATKLAKRLGVRLDGTRAMDFPSGSMFWARSAALRPLVDLGLSTADFARERGQTDATLAHAIERLYYFTCERAGYTWMKVARPELCPETPAIAAIESPEGFRDFVAKRTVSLTRPDSLVPRSKPPPLVTSAAPTLARTLQTRALGIDRPARPHDVAIGIVTYDNSPRQVGRIVESATMALRRAGCNGSDARVFIVDHGSSTEAFTRSQPLVRLASKGNQGFGAGHNRLMREAFERGADLYIAANPDGAFEPDAIMALSRMVRTHDDQALIEALQFPAEHPKAYNPFTFETPWASGACLAIPRRLYERVGAFDESFFMYCEDVDLSWRVRALGLPVLICPRALFLHAVTNRDMGPETLQRIYSSGVILARKWVAPKFEKTMRRRLSDLGAKAPEVRPKPVPVPWRAVADFSKEFSFAPVRW
jgi:GT2 family glycosyltransferase